jgi:hypothetical protein
LRSVTGTWGKKQSGDLPAPMERGNHSEIQMQEV